MRRGCLPPIWSPITKPCRSRWRSIWTGSGCVGSRWRDSSRKAICGRPDLQSQGVNRLGEGKILLGHRARVMGFQGDLDAIVAVGPIGMMAGLFGQQRHPRHEGESLRKILEFIAFGDRA